MPICSYLIQVDPPRVQDVQADLAALPGCTTRVSEDGRVIILVTDTPDLAAEADLQHALKCLRGIDGLALAFGYTEPEHIDEMAASGLPEVAG